MDEFQKRLSAGESFVKRVIKEEKIMLKGNPNFS
jgi:hypothetical protein